MRLGEHRKDLEQVSSSRAPLTRATARASQSERNKSAITDHAIQQNHAINCEEAKIIDRETDRNTRWIREAIAIRKEGGHVMNRYEGQYPLVALCDPILTSEVSSVRDRQTV